MNFLKDLGFAFIAFAAFGALTAAGILRPSIANIVHGSAGTAIIIYASVLLWSGWHVPRAISLRLRALAATWFFQALAIATNADGFLLLTAFITSIATARYILKVPLASSMPKQPKQ